MQARKFSFGPVALTTTLTTDILNPADAGTGQVGYTPTASYIILTHITISNKTTSAATASLWKGATGANAAGTEFWVSGKSVPANDSIHWYGSVRLDTADFLVGGAGTATALTISGEGEIGLV